MTELFTNPVKSDEIVKELLYANSKIVVTFAKEFSKEIYDFAELYIEAYNKHLELNRLLIKDVDEQKAHVVGLLTYLLFDNLLTSTKLFLMGYKITSGDLMRQVIETVELITLCSLEKDIRIKNKENKYEKIHFLTCFLTQNEETASLNTLRCLEYNYKDVGISKEVIGALKREKNYFNKYKHTNLLQMAITFFSDSSGKVHMNNSNRDEYAVEFLHRNDFCRILLNIIEELISRIKNLT